MTGGGAYAAGILILLPFISRERFWYYMLTFALQSNLVALFKFSFHDPRPTFVWKGIMSTGCSTSFGNPSGHSLEAANLPLMLILDHFVASKWSKQAYPKLNLMTKSKNPGALILFIIFGFIFWPLIVFDRLFLGKHTLNQVFLGSQIGFWLALFMHFCIRDILFNHITNISNSNHRING